MTPIAAPADKRFRRAHVKPSGRRRAWRALVRPAVKYALAAGVLVYGGYRASVVAAQAHMLQVDRIVVRGNERLSKGEVLAVLNGMRGQSLVFADLDAWRTRLLASAWVRDAALRRSLPSTVEIVISERRPIGIGRINGEMYLIDERGVVIDEYGPRYGDFDLPVIDGLAVRSREDGLLTDEARADLAARLIAALGASPAVAKRLSQVDVTDVHNASVILDGDSAVIHLGDDQFLARLQSYLDLASALRERVADIESVDLRFEDRIYVRPAPASKRAKPVGRTDAKR